MRWKFWRRKYREHPCFQWCGEMIYGILEKQKRLGDLSEDVDPTVFSITSKRQMRKLPKDIALFMCPNHKRPYVIFYFEGDEAKYVSL